MTEFIIFDQFILQIVLHTAFRPVYSSKCPIYKFSASLCTYQYAASLNNLSIFHLLPLSICSSTNHPMRSKSTSTQFSHTNLRVPSTRTYFSSQCTLKKGKKTVTERIFGNCLGRNKITFYAKSVQPLKGTK
jgi:hypothetical protein